MIIKGTPFNHQITAFNKLNNGGALLMEQGTGKTQVMIALIGENLGLNALVVCPLSVIGEWKRQFEEWAGFDTDVQIYDKNKPLRPGVLLINYEKLNKAADSILPWLFGGLLFLDESQKIKTPKSNMTQAAWRLGSVASKRWIASGTPIMNNPLDLWSQFRFVDPSILEKNFLLFKERYAILDPVYMKPVAFKNLDKLSEKIAPYSFRITKKECLDLPETIDQYLFVNMPKSCKKEYEDINKKFKDEISKAFPDMAELSRYRIFMWRMSGGMRDSSTIAWDDKFSYCFNFVSEKVRDGESVVIFAHFLSEIRELVKRFRESGIPTAYICGDVSMNDRITAIRDFQNKKTPVIVCQIDAGGVGITLTAASICVFYSMNFSPGAYEQAKARLHRIGQTNKVSYVHIMSDGMDNIIHKVVKRKIQWSENSLQSMRMIAKE